MEEDLIIKNIKEKREELIMAGITNITNYGIAIGIVSNIKRFDNKDGSRKYMISVATKNAYTNQDGTVGTQYVRTEKLINKNATSDGVYGWLEKGMLVNLAYTVKSKDYTDNAGTKHYNTVLEIQQIDVLDTKATMEAKRAAANNANKEPEERGHKVTNTDRNTQISPAEPNNENSIFNDFDDDTMAIFN